MNKILIPTDFSEHSNYALEYASFIVKVKGGELIILHIAKNKEEVNGEFELIKNYKYLDGVDFKIVIEEGSNVSKSINKVGVELNIDLIIMGSNGISNVGEMLLGSNTENVIRNSHFNVLTIKYKMFGLDIKTILFPSDFSKETYSVFKTVVEYSELFDATIHLLYVSTSSGEKKVEKLKNRVKELVDYFNLSEDKYKVSIASHKNQEFGIIHYATDNDIDLITIGSHGKSVLHKLIQESTSQNLVRDSFKPILTIRFS